MKSVIGIGDNVCDKYRHLGLMFPGGQAFNFAAFCRMEGYDSAYIGSFGNDGVATHILEVAREMGIDVSHARRYEGENGYAEVDLRDGERVFVGSNKGGISKIHPLVFSQSDLSYIANFSLIHTSNNSYTDEVIPQLGTLDNLLSYDFSTDWTDEKRTAALCPFLDFAFLSCSDIPLTNIREQLKNMHQLGCGIAVATRGAEGSIAYNGQSFQENRPEPLKAIDTMGAGDSFASGFLMAYLETDTNAFANGQQDTSVDVLDGCLRRGAKLAARTCMVQGAFGYSAPIRD